MGPELWSDFMMRERHFSRRGFRKAYVLALTLLLCGSYLFAAEPPFLLSQESTGGQVAHKFVTLTHIPAEQGRKYLKDLKLCTASKMPSTNALLVTGQPRELAKAAAVLKLVDAKERFVIRAIFPASSAKSLPSNKQIAAAVGGISIGNFSNPPLHGRSSAKAIIDIHNDEVLAIAPASQLEKIISAIEQLQKAGKQNTLQFTQPKADLSVKEHRTLIPAVDKVSEAGRITFQPKSGLKVAPNIIGKSAPGGPDLSSLSKVQKTPPQVDSSDKFRLTGNQSRAGKAKPVPAQTDVAKTYDNNDWATTRSYEPEPIPNGNETLALDLPDKVDIVHLLGLAGQYLNLDFMYDPAQVKGDVTLLLSGKLQGPIQVKDLYPLLESVLKFKGFVMTRHKGNLVTVVRAEDALKIDPELVEPEKGKIEHGDMIITRIFELQHIGTDSAENLLKNMELGVRVTPLAEVKKLIVTGFAFRMPRIESLLNMVDKPGEPRRFRFRQLQYTMAQTLAPKIETLAEHLGTVSITVAAEPTVQVPTVTRRQGESDASYKARVAAAQRSAQLRAQQIAAARTRAPKPAEPTQPTVYLDADERTNRILMIGLQEQLDLVEGLIDTLDVEQQDLRTLGVYKIEHVEAEEVKNKLAELGIITARPETTTSRITTPTRLPTKPTTSAIATSTMTATTQESLLEEPQVVVIESTNSLLINATDEQHFRIASIIAYVDSQMEEEEIPYQLYPLENQSPGHLAEVLQSLIQETTQEEKEDKTIERIVKRKEENIVIVPDPNTFSLIVYASRKNQDWIAGLIEKLDKRRPQVLIDVTLVEISKSDAFNLDLNLIESFSDLTKTSGLTGGLIPVTEPVNLVEALTNRPTGSRPDRFIDLQSSSGSGVGFYGDRHINALLTAMQEKNYGRILAKPKILVNDNMEGMIRTEDTTYVTRTSSIPVASGAAGQQTTLIQTAEEFEPFDAGITLGITPHISEGDLLRLDINLIRSDFGTITGEKPPDTTTSEINTTVTVPDGSTIILGGLLKLNQSKGGKKVPLLGDIPLVGGLFRGVSNNDIQKKLYVFVKAEVIRPEDTTYAMGELVRISDRNRAAFEKHEQEFQKYQDWPGIDPKPIDPLKVLEAE